MSRGRTAALAASLTLAGLLAACANRAVDSPSSGDVLTSTTSDPAGTEPAPVPDGSGASTTAGNSGSAGGAPAVTTRPAPPPPGPDGPASTLSTGEVRIRGDVATVDSDARSFVLTTAVSGYRVVLTEPTTVFTTAEREQQVFSDVRPGTTVSITGQPAGGDRIRAVRLVIVE